MTSAPGAANPGIVLPRRGMMLILSSPSGAGKTTLTRDLLSDRSLDLELSISVTTRARRSSEVDGIHYHFLKSRQEFDRMRAADELLEWAEVHGNCYGTPLDPVDARLATGRDMLFDVDYQGAQQIRAKRPADAVTVFILPPSMKELRARLERRAEDSREAIQRRLENARTEIQRWTMYDYVIVNQDIQVALGDVRAIIQAERVRRSRQAEGVDAFVRQLLSE